jgi:predicted PurR-regulated permease PerM
MSAIENDKLTQDTTQKNDGRKQNIFLAKIGLMVFLTFVCCILFFFSLFRYDDFASGWHQIIKAAQPIIIGLVLAYLLHPIMQRLEKIFYRFLHKHMKKEEKAHKLARVLAIVGAILFLVLILVLLIAAIVPTLITSIAGLTDTLPGSVAKFIKMIQNGRLGKLEVTDTISSILTRLTEYLENWVSKTLLPQAQTYVVQITSGVITMFKALLNFIIGIIVAAYVLMIQEKLTGQAKKLVYAVLRPKQGNVIIEIVHKANEIFGGFISGKLIDSAIIGLICYIG